MVPSFRWLKMILYRETIVDDIIRSLWLEGHRFPQHASVAIKKLWFTLDISDNIRRVGLLHNEEFWTPKDLFVVTMFFIKLDMCLTDPVTGNGEIGLRRLLLNQRSLSTLAKVLRREEMKNQLDLLRMLVRYSYSPPIQPTKSILGVPAQKVGKLQYEGWGIGAKKFVPIDGLVAREALRRRLYLQNFYVDMMLYGYIDKRTWEDIRMTVPRNVSGNWKEEEDEEERGSESKARSPERVFLDDENEEEELEAAVSAAEEEAEEEEGEEERENSDLDGYDLEPASRDQR